LKIAALVAGVLCFVAVVLDAFQTIILPQRQKGQLRITRVFFILTWAPLAALAPKIVNKRNREFLYAAYGPLSLILLLVVWAVLLIFGFALMFFALGSPLSDTLSGSGNWAKFRTDLYVSGTSLFTLGLGDVVPHSLLTRALIVLESGVGLGFVALVIGYLPVLYQAFSRREINIALLDSRAGSPPNAAELLRRHGFAGGQEALITLLAEWERWSAEILESHISYPILCYYRSQHDTQSWLAALVAILDTCSLLVAVVEGISSRQAQLTFVMARHALIDLANTFGVQEASDWENWNAFDRLPAADFYQLCDALGDVEMQLCGDPAAAERLHTMRALYEPYALSLGDYLKLPLPVWAGPKRDKDQWAVLTKLRSEAQAASGGGQAGRVGDHGFLHEEEH